jgi:hypothetical protein
LEGGAGADTFVFSVNDGEGADTITDFDGTADILRFTDVLDLNTSDGALDLADLNDVITSVADSGEGNNVVVNFESGATITFAGIGTGSIESIDLLVSDSDTQIEIL